LSFRLKTILGIALIETLLLLILVFSSINFLVESNSEQLKQRAQATVHLYASAAKDALLALDQASLDSITQEVSRHQGVIYARIRNSTGVLAQAGQERALAHEFVADDELSQVLDESFDVTLNIDASGYTYGHVELGLSTQSVQSMFGKARRWVVGIAILEVLLVAIFSYVLGTYLTHRLARLKDASASIRRHGPGYQVVVKGRDELSDVANEFNRMSQSLADTYDALKTKTFEYRQLAQHAGRNEAMNQAILSVSLDGIISIDQHGIIVEFNQVASDILGWTLGDVIGQDMAEIIVPTHYRQAHRQGMKTFLETGEGPVLGKRLELEALHKSGRVIPIEIAISPIQIDDVTLFTAFIRDLSERKKAADEQRLAAQAFETIEPMFITNAEAKILRVNSAFTTVTGYRADEVEGKDPRVLSSGRQDQAFYQELWQSLLSKGRWSGEIYNQRKNGEVYPERLTITAVKDDDEAISHFIAHFVDISEQKENERNLDQARKQAENANAAKSRFLATMSHEIRSPLNAVVTMSRLLQESELNPEQNRYAQMIFQGGETLLALINDLLDFSKIESDNLVLSSAWFDLRSALSACVELLSQQADQKGIRLTYLAPDELAPCYFGDELRIRQIAINLLSNAIKFTDKGRVVVRLSVFEAGISIEVEDTGIGIDKRQQGTIFSEFVQVESDDRRRFGGTGLGLAISQRLVAKMGGTIKCSSTLGIGSCFEVYLPLPAGEADSLVVSADDANLAYSSSRGVMSSAMIKRVLLVEDNLINQEVALALLKNEQVMIDIAGNGLIAFEMASSQVYDLILMDLAMPEMNGIESTTRIRSGSAINRNTPIIAMTANAFIEDRQRCFDSGMDDYIAKPLDVDLFRQKVAYWLHLEASFIQRNFDNAAEPIGDPSLMSESLIDERVLKQLQRDVSPEIFIKVLCLYFEETHKRLLDIAQAAEHDAWENLEALAHQLKSSSGSVGAIKLQKQAAVIEKGARAKDRDVITSVCPTLMALYNASATKLREFMERTSDISSRAQ
jgi:PAS domain S-box-containing protein